MGRSGFKTDKTSQKFKPNVNGYFLIVANLVYNSITKGRQETTIKTEAVNSTILSSEKASLWTDG